MNNLPAHTFDCMKEQKVNNVTYVYMMIRAINHVESHEQVAHDENKTRTSAGYTLKTGTQRFKKGKKKKKRNLSVAVVICV